MDDGTPPQAEVQSDSSGTLSASARATKKPPPSARASGLAIPASPEPPAPLPLPALARAMQANLRRDGRECGNWRSDGSRVRASYILIPQFALTPFIQDKSL